MIPLVLCRFNCGIYDNVIWWPFSSPSAHSPFFFNTVTENSVWIIDNSEQINFWLDNWMGSSLVSTLNTPPNMYPYLTAKFQSIIVNGRWQLLRSDWIIRRWRRVFKKSRFRLLLCRIGEFGSMLRTVLSMLRWLFNFFILPQTELIGLPSSGIHVYHRPIPLFSGA